MFFLLDKSLSEGKGQITGMFSTKNFSGRFFVDNANHIFIPVQHTKNFPIEKVIQQGFTTEYGFDFQPDQYFDAFRYFYEKWENINAISELNQTKHDSVTNKQPLKFVEWFERWKEEELWFDYYDDSTGDTYLGELSNY